MMGESDFFGRDRVSNRGCSLLIPDGGSDSCVEEHQSNGRVCCDHSITHNADVYYGTWGIGRGNSQEFMINEHDGLAVNISSMPGVYMRHRAEG